MVSHSSYPFKILGIKRKKQYKAQWWEWWDWGERTKQLSRATHVNSKWTCLILTRWRAPVRPNSPNSLAHFFSLFLGIVWWKDGNNRDYPARAAQASVTPISQRFFPPLFPVLLDFISGFVGLDLSLHLIDFIVFGIEMEEKKQNPAEINRFIIWVFKILASKPLLSVLDYVP